MKRTSVAFIIIAILLIITGFILKAAATKKAEIDDITLFRQTLTESGDLVETIDISDKDTNKIYINLDNTDINIVGGADFSYIEVINFNTLGYAVYNNNRTLTLENDIMSSLLGRAEGGQFGFNGIRDYLRFQKHNPEKKVNIYLSESSNVKIFDIQINSGNISFDKVSIVSDYILNLNKGNITFTNTPEISLLDVKSKSGNLSLNDILITKSDIELENGNLEYNNERSISYSYNLECEVGEIKIGNETFKGEHKNEVVSPLGIFNAKIGVGNIIVILNENISE